MIDLCQWRASIGSWNCSCHWRQPSACTSTGNTYCETGRASAGDTAQEKGPRLFLSIFCLLLLLFISGDVELNPGPTLTDKPTKDELVELLSSSKFTAGTWEQFVCCLPNMSQGIISNVKQREELVDAEPVDSISAVAQRCLDDNSEITWKVIVMSLLDAKECVLTKQVLTKIECSCAGRKGTKVDATITVETTLRKHFASLFYATEDCLESVTVEFFSKSLISRDVRKSPSFYKIENEFVASLFFCEEDMIKLEEKCRNFIHCLAKAGGPAKDAAIALAEDWERDVLNKHNLKWSLMIDIKTLTDLSLPSEIPLSSEVPQKVQDLHKSFLLVMKHIRTYYNECKQYNVEDFARYLTDDYEVPLTEEPLTNCKSLDSLFYSVKSHYSFFKFDLIEDLVKEFPPSDELQLELDQYVQELEEFKKSTALQQMKNAIKQAPIPHEASEAHCKIVIKLTGSWRKKTVKSLENLIQYLFERDAKRAKLIEIDDGSIVITFLALSTSQSLIDKVQNKVQFIQYLGIFEIIINNDIVIEREEDSNFTFEDSLLHAINHIESHAGYERVALLLIKLKIKLNYKNTDDQTALMLASVGGHIEIFKSLLQNCTDPFVQLPAANGGHIGLNHLACTALSQHIYKSVGGEKIIPRDDTSVEDILEMAVKERGASRSFYSSYLLAHLSYLRAKFLWLQNCFNALNSNFIDVGTNLLTSKALVTEAKQHFQSYIEEDATCENAHQLLQLLQPHYSCLNINLLTIPCTITEPIKEQVEEYNANLKMFKDTTSLLELAMMTKGMSCPDGVGCSKIILRLNKAWCSRTIAELNKMENFYLLPISSFLTLEEVHRSASNFTCVYLLPQLNVQISIEAVIEQTVSLHKIGVFEVMIDDIPIMMEDEDKSFTFEAALQEAHQNNNESLVFFLLELNISSPLINGNTDLMIASRRGDILTVQFLLNKDPDINIQNNNGSNALMAASANGHHQVVELLLSKDPDINIQGNDGWTALIIASRYGHHQVVELLLSKDADINIQNDDGVTALMFASANGHHQVVKLLLSKDPDINIQDNDGWTALMFASSSGHHQVVELLLSKDADINIQRNDGWTALMYASGNGHYRVVQLMLSKNPDINIQDNDGWTALITASRYGHHQVVELLLSKNPDINIQNNNGLTALMSAALYGHHQVVEFLLSKDPDINIQDNNDGWTALITASHYGYHQVVKLLLSKDPDINIQDNDGWTALITASRYGYHQVVELLLSKDPDIDIQNNNGLTALMGAALYRHHQVVELLLSKDPDINIQSNNGWTALMFASSNGHHQVVELLLSKDPDINIQSNNGWTALMAASTNGHHQVVELLLGKDPDINIQHNDGWTALVAASEYGHHQVVELLLSKDPDINIQSKDGSTALMLASTNGHHQVIELLLSKDPDINIKSDDGLTAFTIILLWSNFISSLAVDDIPVDQHPHFDSRNYIKTLELLLDSHPNHVHTVGGMKFHSLEVAVLSNNFDAFAVLMEKCDITLQNIISAFTVACCAGHSSMIIHLSEKITTLPDNERNLLVTAAEGDLGTLISMIYEVGMSPDTPLVAGITPLMVAASSGHIELVDTLIQAGADINKRNDERMNALDIVNGVEFYNRSEIKQLLITNTPAVEPDPVSNNDETTNKKSTTGTAIKSILGIFNSFMKKSYDPYYSKQKELKIPYGTVTDAPYSAMTSNNMAQFVS